VCWGGKEADNLAPYTQRIAVQVQPGDPKMRIQCPSYRCCPNGSDIVLVCLDPSETLDTRGAERDAERDLRDGGVRGRRKRECVGETWIGVLYATLVAG
jgi:hypothetical protein